MVYTWHALILIRLAIADAALAEQPYSQDFSGCIYLCLSAKLLSRLEGNGSADFDKNLARRTILGSSNALRRLLKPVYHSSAVPAKKTTDLFEYILTLVD